MYKKRYMMPEILSHRALVFETKVSGQCDDNGYGDDKNGDPDNGQGYCHTANPHDPSQQ